MIYNYRFDRDLLSTIVERLRTERTLSQGWGGGRDMGLNVADADFVAKCRDYYQLATTRVPSNLTRIRDLKRGDLLVTPHMPANGEVSIHVVADDFPACYQYAADDDHQNHRIAIERSYGLDGEVSVHNLDLAAWYGKLQWLRLPLVPIPQQESVFRGIIGKLEQSPGHKFGASRLAEYLQRLRSQLMAQLNAELLKVRPSSAEISFEAICERLLVSAGYRVVGRNQYDSKGGDVDLRCVRDRSDVSPFEAGQAILLVQVKKHTGTTDDWSVKQVLKMMEQEPQADGCVMSLAESFTKEAQELAEKNGVLLMTGDIVCGLLLEELAGQAAR